MKECVNDKFLEGKIEFKTKILRDAYISWETTYPYTINNFNADEKCV